MRIKTHPQHTRLCVLEILTPYITVSEYDNHSESRCQHSWGLGEFSKAHLLNQGSFCDHTTLRECLLTSHTGGRDAARPFRKGDFNLVSALTPSLLEANDVILKREGTRKVPIHLSAGSWHHRTQTTHTLELRCGRQGSLPHRAHRLNRKNSQVVISWNMGSHPSCLLAGGPPWKSTVKAAPSCVSLE